MVEPLPRLWLVFFNDGHSPAWWARFCRPGFRHVCAAAWYADQQRWVYFDPTRTGIVVEVAEGEAFGPRFQELLVSATAVLRIRSQRGRRAMPALCYCVGAVKALLGVRSRALSPAGLYRDLLRVGAEQVEQPDVELLRRRRAAPTPAGGSCSGAGAAAATATG